MSTVLWANHLLNTGTVVSDEQDKWALYQYAATLDELAHAAKLEPFTSLLDHTDLQFQINDEDLPATIQSTNQLMAREGVWQSAHDALAILHGLLEVIHAEKTGIWDMKNDRDAIVAELSESIAYAEKAREINARFNFSVIM